MDDCDQKQAALQKQPQLKTEMNQLEKIIFGITEAIVGLESKISIILTPACLEEPKDKKSREETGMAPLALMIRELNRALQEQEDRIHNLINRCEL